MIGSSLVPGLGEAPEPGDLVFFNDAGHVGIYVGNGEFVHAPHTGGSVELSSLSTTLAGGHTGAVRVGPL